ncbi:MAG TPA: hypothetical protein VKI44_13740 [Acetobacteraceae bacterium]|nr:hypothetical protein [Acetobacteraceae bacterium]
MGTQVGAFNAVVDPYLVTGAPRIAGFNAIKPETGTHTGLAKRYLFARLRPAGLVLGDSKADIGIDPGSPNWPEDARPGFNYGVPAIGLPVALDILRHAIVSGPITRALVLIDIEEFMKPADATAPTAEPATETPSAAADFRQHVQDLLLATLSLDALRASVMTVAAQGRHDVVDLSPAGVTSEGGFRAVSAREGYGLMFQQKDEYLARMMAWLAAALRARPGAPINELDAVADMIRLCRDRGIALDLAIAPSHADYLDAIDRAGLWPRYRDAKKQLTLLIAAEGGDAVRLWDFLGYDGYSTEPVPPVSDRAGTMHWYWEPSHFKQALGEKILATIYQGGNEFGVRLTPDMIASHLERESNERTSYRARSEPLAHSSR